MNSSAEAPSAAPESRRNSPPAMKTRLPFTVARIRAMSEELVTTVSRRCCNSARAMKLVVVPVSSMTDSPSPIPAATARAMARLAAAFSRIRRSNGASPVCPANPTAPWLRTADPASTSARISRRAVSAEMPRISASSATGRIPCPSSSFSISACRRDAMSAPNLTAADHFSPFS